MPWTFNFDTDKFDFHNDLASIPLGSLAGNSNEVLFINSDGDAVTSDSSLTHTGSPNYILNANMVNIPTTAATGGTPTAGVIFMNSNPMIHAYGTNNHFTGYNTGNFTLTGTNNVGMGYENLTNLTDGSNNFASGDQALNALTSGDSNVAIGTHAMLIATSASNNIAIGHLSMDALTQGTSNVAIGTSTLSSANQGVNNVAIGLNAMDAATGVAGYNIAVGAGSLGGAAGMVNNTIVGGQAGGSLTGNSNVFLGFFAGGTQTTNSNLLIIDNQNRTDPDGELANALIYGEFAATTADQSLRINAPVGILTDHVNGVALNVLGTQNFAGTGTWTSGGIDIQDGSIHLQDDKVLSFGGTKASPDVSASWLSSSDKELKFVFNKATFLHIESGDTNGVISGLPTIPDSELFVVRAELDTIDYFLRTALLVAQRNNSVSLSGSSNTDGLNAFAYHVNTDTEFKDTSDGGLRGGNYAARVRNHDGTITNSRGVQAQGIAYIGSSNSGKVTNAADFFAAGALVADQLDATVRVSNAYNFYGTRHLSQGTGQDHIDNAFGIYLENQDLGVSANYGIVLAGDGSGSDIVFGTSKDASIYYEDSGADDGLYLVDSSTNNVIIGDGGAEDWKLTFKGTSANGILNWIGGSDIFILSDAIRFDSYCIMNLVNPIYFRDTGLYINSSADATLDIVSDGAIRCDSTSLAHKEVASEPANISDYGQLWTKSDNTLHWVDGDGDDHVVHGFPSYKSYSLTTRGAGGAGTFFLGGYLQYNAAHAQLTQASTTQTFGTANISYAAHAFIVAGGAATTDGTTVTLTVTGVSINDAGVRNGADSEVIVLDATGSSQDDWYETSKKWLGTVTFTLSSDGANFAFDFNYGISKYEDFNNNDFEVVGIEAVGLAVLDDTIDIALLHYNSTGWTYSAAAFDPVTTLTVSSLATDHTGADDQVDGTPTDQYFAWKRASAAPFPISVSGSGSEGTIIAVTNNVNNSIGYLDIHLAVEF